MTTASLRKIPATVVTGFLGAGKTTLIRNLLARADGRRIALIVNEFGDMGVDGELLRGCGDAACADEDVVELSNGCICCTVADDFIPTLEMLLSRPTPPDHIVIETSGLALPQPLVRAFNWPQIRNRVTVDGVVTVVDGPAVAAGRFAHDEGAVAAQRAADDNLDHETPLAELFDDQLACADLVVVSKSDLLDEEQANALFEVVCAKARQGVRIVRSDAGGLSPRVLLGMGVGAENDLDSRAEIHHRHHDDDHDHDHDHDHDRHHEDAHGHDEFESFALTLPEIRDPAAFRARVEAAIRDHDILRLKGFAAVAGKPMRQVVQAVGPRLETYFDRPFGDEPRVTRLVVIGLAGMDRAAIEAALAEPAPAMA
ncbi:cobalamin biosynthesis protein CobW [Oceanicella actignis]|uniref:Cobalamin biosynthesis protein CobW n=1 Tax=Oceanicella actignis TaxID=1189325 RepID=A0A1M7SP76_9RHOB|nr:cobalamin biosynthesis protein CobW [Oceanicella actignis]TYO90871.1 cobalamin biosynthesis protein CobW [Oceanicella actignis]SES65045.1 cobalamin biosynthesis protein CobW [Oceanicella actignis]SHN60199.1 cobalamin biosynthesis protein CobW [Oceanicella actignis]